MLSIGDLAPAITANDQDGKPVSLADFKGKKVVLFFYPKDNTPTCTEQACDLRDNVGALKKAGYAIIGVSIDDEKSHRRFIKKFGLPFPLLADTDHAIVDAYGVWGEKTLFGRKYMGTLRTTFILDEKGIITRIIDKVKAKEHTAQILG
jgi:peroxiredoxin Q/BCP